MPTISRKFSFIYGAVTVGGSSDDYLFTGKYSLLETYDQARVSFDFVAVGTSDSDFVTTCQTVEDEFRKIRSRLRIIQGAETMRDYDPAAGAGTNTGFDAVPTLTKPGSSIDGQLARLYRMQVVVQLPADLTGQDARKDNTYRVQYDANRRRIITIRGRYTALGANNATAQYEAEISDYFDSVKPAGVGWELVAEETERNDTDKSLDWSRTYREITLEQSEGAADGDDASVKEQSIVVTEETVGAEDTFIDGGATKPLKNFTIEARFVVDIETTDHTGLVNLWDTTLRSHALNQALAKLGTTPFQGSFDIDQVGYDPENNVITASMRYRTSNGSNTVRATLTKQCLDESGLVLTPLTNGAPHSKAIDEGPPLSRLRITIDQTILSGGTFFIYVPPADYWPIRADPAFTEVRVGDSPSTITQIRRIETKEYEYAKEYTGGGAVTRSSGGGGGRRVTTVTRGTGGGGAGFSSAVGRDKNIVTPCEIQNFNGSGV